jgi:hypothetical protein
MKKPTRSNFKATNRSLAEIEKDMQKVNNSGVFGGIFAIYFFGMFIVVGLSETSSPQLTIISSVVIFIIFPFLFWYQKKKNLDATLNINNLEIEYENRRRFEQAFSAWNDYNSFTGKKFWLSHKGEKLEREFQNLASFVGWDSWLTPTSGDGGIDVICENKAQERTLLIQCKGHSKPVGVAAIRDAVGVAAMYEGEMIVVSPIGFTKGSFNLARQSGIKLLSATNLVNIAAKKEQL